MRKRTIWCDVFFLKKYLNNLKHDKKKTKHQLEPNRRVEYSRNECHLISIANRNCKANKFSLSRNNSQRTKLMIIDWLTDSNQLKLEIVAINGSNKKKHAAVN